MVLNKDVFKQDYLNSAASVQTLVKDFILDNKDVRIYDLKQRITVFSCDNCKDFTINDIISAYDVLLKQYVYSHTFNELIDCF